MQERATEGQVMAQAVEDRLAFPDKRAAELAGISMRQLRHWEKTGLVVPSVRRQISPRNTVRLYSFQDLVELLVVAELRHRPEISLQHIRRLVTYLSSLNLDAPLRELKFATRGKEIYINFPDGSWSGDPVPDQVIFRQAIALDDVVAKISRARERDPEAAGEVTSRRGVHRSKPVFAGTRIPVAAVQRYLDAGYDTAAIIREYPSLTPEDVETARHHAAAG
jgi:DNA-binding transcriptional MerR regulator